MSLRTAPYRTHLAVSVCLACIILFVCLAVPRAWVNDDAFITFRYARNLATGYGFVWNTVESQRVEGTSSLGWTLLNAAALRAGLEPLGFSQWTGLAAGALALAAVALGARGLGVGFPGIAIAMGLLALQGQWILWSVSGMETASAALLGLVATLRLLRELREGRSGWQSGVFFSVATLFRPETPLLHAAAGIGAFVAARDRRTWRSTIVSGAVHAAALAALTLWRQLAFGQPLPNTFYVKVGALQLDRGTRFLGEFLLQNHAWLWLALVALALPWLWRHTRLALAVLAAQVLVWCAWLAGIGGDQWEFRLMVPILPLLALLVGMALDALVRQPRRWLHVGAALLATAIVSTQVLGLGRAFRPFADLFAAEQLDAGARYMGLEAELLSPYLGPDVRICTGWAGVLPYRTGAWHLDPWGLNDPAIARRPLDPQRVVFHQRHAAWADVVARRVLFCDAFNHFLFPQPFDPRQQRTVVPWVDAGLPIYSVRLPAGHFWLFASGLPRAEVEAYLARHNLPLVSVQPLPAGWPRLGG